MGVPEIRITIGKDGNISAEVVGVEGQKCTDLSKFLDQLGQVTEDRLTPDYYRDNEQGVTIQPY
jgi:hypothetical protein